MASMYVFNSKRGLVGLSNFHGEGEHNVEFAYMADRFEQPEVKNLLRRLSVADTALFNHWLRALQPNKGKKVNGERVWSERQKNFWFLGGRPILGVLAQLIGSAAKRTAVGALRRKILCRELNLKSIQVKPCLTESEMEALMLRCLRKKFELPEFKQLLLGTGDAVLHEAPMRGVNRWTWKPGNLGGDMLGRLLMQVREEINKIRLLT